MAVLVAELDALRFVGRRGYGSRALLGACVVKALYALPTWTRVADLIAEHPGLSDTLGGTPSHWACYRFATKLRKERERIAGCIDALAASLREAYPEMGREVAIDASDMPAYANGQRFLYNHGPERQAYSDPDASWGHRSAVSTRKGGGFYGYKIHAAVCARTGLPLAWEVETGRRNESLYVAPLLDAVHARGFAAETCAMDRGYDNNRVYAECHERGIAPVIPLRKGRIQPETPIKRGTPQWGDLYRRRTSVEREFGRLKHDYGLAFLRVRGIQRVRLHADLVMLGRLSLALARARGVPLASA
ncbi:MAG: transposase [Gaiellaceae bacterium MAG52_C11]|nr:transposase [Candidatus Gaiellasilicea maunaloa]